MAREQNMREERGQIAGDFTVTERMNFWGTVGGNLIVEEGGKVYLRGAVYGDVIVKYGGRCHIFGRVIGNLAGARGAKVIHSGVLGGDATNDGGRLYIENTAQINGKIKTVKGETKISALFQPAPPNRE